MTKTMRTCLAAIAAMAALSVTAAPSTAAAPKPARSGTITGWGATWVAMFNGEARDCQWSEWWGGGGNPECLAWLKSGCNPALAGREPAVTASIVDVAGLADGTTPRAFHWRATSYPGWGVGGGVVIQMWRKDCTEIRSSEWRSLERFGTGPWSRWSNRTSTWLTIPTSAKWMTVTTNDTAKLRWTLR